MMHTTLVSYILNVVFTHPIDPKLKEYEYMVDKQMMMMTTVMLSYTIPLQPEAPLI